MTRERLLVTAIGSMPGTNMAETMLQVTDAIPDLIAMPELPQRGPGAEMIGRTFGILNDLDTSFSIETTVTGWRQSRGENKVMRRAKSWYQEDLDWLEKSVGSDSLNLKLQFAGPLTLASFIEPPAGERLLSDAGAVRDLAAGMGEALALQLAAVQKRLPQAKISIQLDEPALELAIQGGLKRRSGRGHLEPVPSEQATEWINAVVHRIQLPQELLWIHSCATNFQAAVFEKFICGMWALPLSAINQTQHYQVLSDFWDRGGMVALGIDPRMLVNQVDFQSIIATVNKFARQIGLSVEEMPARIGLSPECGLAYISEPLNVLKKLHELSRAIPAEY